MPYIFVEELPEDAEEADVVERSELDSAITERDDARNQRDEAIERATQAESDLKAQKEKYANTFLSSRQKTPEPNKKPVAPKTMDMFKIGGGF